jgi:hypothetical protein
MIFPSFDEELVASFLAHDADDDLLMGLVNDVHGSQVSHTQFKFGDGIWPEPFDGS